MHEPGLQQVKKCMLGTEVEIIVAMASIFAVVETFKVVYPEWVESHWLKRLMPAVPLVLGMIGMMIYAVSTNEIEIIRAIPLGIMGGSLSATAYELIKKLIRGKVNEDVREKSFDDHGEETSNELEDWSKER